MARAAVESALSLSAAARAGVTSNEAWFVQFIEPNLAGATAIA